MVRVSPRHGGSQIGLGTRRWLLAFLGCLMPIMTVVPAPAQSSESQDSQTETETETTDAEGTETEATGTGETDAATAALDDLATLGPVSRYNAADTSSPRDTLRSFINACNELNKMIRTEKYFDRTEPHHVSLALQAMDCIDDSEIPGFAREERIGEVVACLKEIIDRVDLPPWQQIPDRAEIAAKGGVEKLSYYRIPDTRITISRVESGPRRHEYLFSPGTADRAQQYFWSIRSKPYRETGPEVSEGLYRWYVTAPGSPILGAIVERLPEFFRLERTFGVANWTWLGLALLLAVTLFVCFLVYRAYFRWTKSATEEHLLAYWSTLVFPIFAMLIPLGFNHAAYRYLTVRSTPLYVISFICILLSVLAGILVVFSLTNRIAATVIATPRINKAGLNAQLIRILSKLASLIASVALLLVGGQYLGIPIATLLASAGIGGVAVALGAQDSLKTLFGTVNLLTDKPFRVGDRIVMKSYDGVVEDIGLRSSKLRLLNGNQVTIPNDQLAGNDIENVGRRPFIRHVGCIRIPLNTPCKKVEEAVEIIRDELKDHEGMEETHPPHVFLDEFAADAFCIRYYYWYSPPDFWKFKAFGDRLNFNIFRRFEEAGIQFSLPVRHTHYERQDASDVPDTFEHEQFRG